MRALDRAGNLSTVTTFDFGSGEDPDAPDVAVIDADDPDVVYDEDEDVTYYPTGPIDDDTIVVMPDALEADAIELPEDLSSAERADTIAKIEHARINHGIHTPLAVAVPQATQPEATQPEGLQPMFSITWPWTNHDNWADYAAPPGGGWSKAWQARVAFAGHNVAPGQPAVKHIYNFNVPDETQQMVFAKGLGHKYVVRNGKRLIADVWTPIGFASANSPGGGAVSWGNVLGYPKLKARSANPLVGSIGGHFR